MVIYEKGKYMILIYAYVIENEQVDLHNHNLKQKQVLEKQK